MKQTRSKNDLITSFHNSAREISDTTRLNVRNNHKNHHQCTFLCHFINF